MIPEEITYKVLWVDDDEKNVESTKISADEYGIVLDHYLNWQEAEVALRNNFEDYTAIILDAFCKIKASDDTKAEFITAVLPSLNCLFGEKKKYIPWYILSAGTVENFDFTVKSAMHQHQTKEWGQMLYIKNIPNNDPKNSHFLFENIREIGRNQGNNVVLFRHRDVFEYLGKDKLIDERARKIMLKMLSALYLPEENIKYEYAGNPLRKVVEYIFRAARKRGLLTDKCFDEQDHIVLLDASRYLAGLTIDCYQGRKVFHKARWGKAGKKENGAGGDSVFPSDIAMLVKNILNYSSSDSHTYEDFPYLIDEQNKELFFGYVMQLCYVIKWFGKYAKENPNVEENKKKQVVIDVQTEQQTNIDREKNKVDKVVISSTPPSKDDIKGRKYLIMREGSTYHCGSCKLDSSIIVKSGQVIIEEVISNEGDDKAKYPYIAIKVSKV